MEFINESLLPYWPFIAFALVVGFIAQVLKAQVLTVKMAKKSKFIFWSRRVFPLYLILLGAITGILWPGEPSPNVSSIMEKVWYFMGSSCISITGFNVFKTWIKKKYDVDILTGASEPPDRA